MRTTQQFSITLPHEMASEVKAKVQTGQYATESEVFRDAFRVLAARDRAVTEWLRSDVVTAYEALKADPSRGLSAEQVRATLKSALAEAVVHYGDPELTPAPHAKRPKTTR